MSSNIYDIYILMSGQKYIKTAILAAFALETLSATCGLLIPHVTPVFAILYFVAGIYLGIRLLAVPQLKLAPLNISVRTGRSMNRDIWRSRTNHFRLISILLLALVIYDICKLWFDEIPLELNYADMLPIIKVMGQRFASGHSRQVYDVIPWIWNGVQPIYLPAMWLPFVPAVVLNID